MFVSIQRELLRHIHSTRVKYNLICNGRNVNTFLPVISKTVSRVLFPKNAIHRKISYIYSSEWLIFFSVEFKVKRGFLQQLKFF